MKLEHKCPKCGYFFDPYVDAVLSFDKKIRFIAKYQWDRLFVNGDCSDWWNTESTTSENLKGNENENNKSQCGIDDRLQRRGRYEIP